METLPKDFLNKYQKLGEGSKLFNIPVPNLSHKELIAMIGYMGERMDNDYKMSERTSDFYRAALAARGKD